MRADEIKMKLIRFGDSRLTELCGAMFDSFVGHLKDCNYGGPETVDAWYWFSQGWQSRKVQS